METMECPKCEREIKKDEKKCPYCEYDLVNQPKIHNENEFYEIFKKWALGGIVAIVIIVVVGISLDNNNKATKTTSENISNSKSDKLNKSNNASIAKVEKAKVTVVDFSQMSKTEIEDWCDKNKIRCNFTDAYSEIIEKGKFLNQSINAGNTIEQGDKLTISYSLGKEPTLGQKNSLSMAKSYLAYSSFSYKGLVEQLEYEGFSHEEATYGADNCGADWNEQAAKTAKSYMDFSSFSKKGLIGQLEYEGFTKQQAEYGASKVGF